MIITLTLPLFATIFKNHVPFNNAFNSAVARPPPTEELEKPYTCDSDGWSEWFNLNYPDAEGEFESLAEIRKVG